MALLKRKRIGAGDAMEVVTKFVNACNRHDAEGVSACLHPDFDSIQPMYPTRNFRGATQVRRNWQAIFDAEPGFRLTVLRSASADDTVWLELHGAGDEAEVAGIFIMGIVGDRIRWARIYSALVEPVPAGVGEPPPPLHEVSRAAGDSEEQIAPVLDMERSSRRRRRRKDEADAAAATGGAESEAVDTGDTAESAGTSESAEMAEGAEPPAVAEDAAEHTNDADGEAMAVVEVVSPPPDEGDLDTMAVVADEGVTSAEASVEPVLAADADTDAVGTDAEAVTSVEAEDETGTIVEPAPAHDGLDTDAVPVIAWDAVPEAVAEHDGEPAIADKTTDEPSGRRFGKRRP